MRCPHCRGEIPPESQFCGVCGQNVTPTPTGQTPALSAPAGRPSGQLTPSLFDLPVSKGARTIRVAMILGLNLLLVGGGVALLMEYLNKRERAEAAGAGGLVKVLEDAAPEPTSAPPGALQPVDAGAASGSEGATNVGGARPASNGGSAPAGVDAGVSGARDENRSSTDSGSATGSGGAKGASSETLPSPTARADAGPSRPASKSSDAGLASSPQPTEGASPDDEAERVRVLAAQISLVVDRHQGQLQRCYKSASKASTPDHPFEGRIKVHFSVMPDGSAKSVRIGSNDTGSEPLGRCLVGLVGSWTFPSSGSEALEFVWPFEFQAPK